MDKPTDVISLITYKFFHCTMWYHRIMYRRGCANMGKDVYSMSSIFTVTHELDWGNDRSYVVYCSLCENPGWDYYPRGEDSDTIPW